MNSVWSVVAVALAILILAMIQGKFSGGLLLALAALLLIGSLVPPVGLGLGILALLVIAMRSGAKIVPQFKTTKG